jgi:hypothetical protein
VGFVGISCNLVVPSSVRPVMGEVAFHRGSIRFEKQRSPGGKLVAMPLYDIRSTEDQNFSLAW